MSVLCVYVSVTSRCYTETAQWIRLIFGAEASLGHLSHTVQGNSGNVQNKSKGTSSETLFQTLHLENFATASLSSLGVVDKANDGQTLDVY